METRAGPLRLPPKGGEPRCREPRATMQRFPPGLLVRGAFRDSLALRFSSPGARSDVGLTDRTDCDPASASTVPGR